MSAKSLCWFNVVGSEIKKAAVYFALVFFLLGFGTQTEAQMQLVPGITTAAGDGTAGSAGDGGPATSAELNHTEGVAVDRAGNLYIADWQNNRVRKVDAGTGAITTVAGNGTAGFSGDGAAATSAELKGPTGVIVDPSGNLYIADQANNRVRKVDVATGIITTIAGNGTASFSGDGGLATNAAMFSPTDLTLDSAGNLYISDNANNRIRKVAAGTGIITTYAGNGTAGFAGDSGAATSAALNSPAGLVMDNAGNLYIADVTNNRIRKVAAGTGIITTYAGTGVTGFAGDGGAAASAQFNTPARLALDSAGNLFIDDQSNNRIREIFVATGIITTVAGNGTAGFSGDGGPGTAAAFNSPIGIAIDSANNLYISDFYNNRVRKLAITANNFPSTVVGSTSAVQNVLLQTTATETITSITVPQSQGGKQEYSVGTITGCNIGGSNVAGTVCSIPITFTPAYPGRRWIPLQVVTSTGNINFGLTGIGVGPLAVLTPGLVSTVAGTGTAGFAGNNGPANSARLNTAQGITVDSLGNFFIADSANYCVRKVTAGTGVITTVAGICTTPGYSGNGGPATSAKMYDPVAVAVDSAGNLYVADYVDDVVWKVTAANGIISVVAGNATQGYSGDGGPATSAQLYGPAGVALDRVGNLYITEFNNYRIRKVNAGTGIITTVAGNGTGGYGGDGGPATSARLLQPYGITVDDSGNIFFDDGGNNRVRKIAANTGIITTIAGNGTGGYSGDGGLATSAQVQFPSAITLDSAGNLYFADELNHRVRRIDTAGTITTIAGNGTGNYSGDSGPATKAELFYPQGVSLDGLGNIYIADTKNHRVRQVNVSQSPLNYPTATTVGTSDSTDDPQTAILANIGNAGLTLSTPTSGNNPSLSTNFAFDSASTCPQLGTSSSSATLAVGASCTIAIDFKPLQAGAVTGSAVLTDNSLNVSSTQTINLTATGVAAGTTTTVVGTPNPSVYSQTVVFTAVVTPTVGTAVPTGSVQFSVDGTAVGGPVTLSNGSAAYANNSLSVGSHTITAVYTPDTGSFTASNGSTTQTVNPESTTTTVTSSVNPSTFTQAVTFTAAVTQTIGTAIPTGTVQFSVDGVNVGGPVTLSGGVVTYTTSLLAVGLHTVTAVYTPSSANFTGSSGSIGQRVGAVASSTTTLTVSPTTVMYGNTATLTAVVTPSFATGTVSFYAGSMLLGTASLDSTATAVLPISSLNAGVYNIVAKYNGDPGVPSSTSNTVQLTVTQRTAPGGGPAITITANNASRTTTQANPPFTYSASGTLVNGDTYTTAISGTASYSSNTGSTPGTYSIAVNGLTSQNYLIAFVPGTLTVSITPTMTTLVASATSTQYGDPVTLTATVTSGATGTVSFYDGSVFLGTGQITNGVGTLTTTTLVAGSHSVTAIYNGDATYASSQSSPLVITVAKKQGAGGAAALTITIQNASREYNTSNPQFAYVVTGTLVNGDSYASAVTGPPVYSSADTATSPSGSTFPINVSGLTSANYEIAFVNGTLTIANAPTTTALTASTSTAQYGDPVTLTATVAPSNATGTVIFTNGSIVLGAATVTNGTATLTTSSLNVGSYTITASYQGDGNYAASTSTPVALTIGQKTGPGGTAALTVTVTNASRFYGQGNPAFTYTISGGLVNGDTYAIALAGVAVYSTTAVPLSAAGNYPISIGGLNSQNYLIAFVNGTLAVAKDTPGQNGTANITLSSSPNPSMLGQSVTFTATVPAGATGTVQFMEGTTLLGTATINGTTATFTTSTLAAGTHPVTAIYSGDANYSSASSSVDNQVVNYNLDFTLTLTSAGSQSAMPGDAAPYKVQVAPTNVTYPGTVTFSATGLPPGATISFTPNTVAANGGPTPSNVSIQTAPQKAALNHSSIGSTVLALLMLPFATARRIRKSARRSLFVIIVLLGGLAATTGLTGCGYNGNGFFGQAPKTYNITLTATSGTIQHSVNVTLEVQ